jgi:septum formation protein
MKPLIDIPKKIVLASASPRRKELLAQIGISFDVIPSMVEEGEADKLLESGASDYVCHLADLKASDTASRTCEDCLVIGADTIVLCKGRILGKPRDRADAAAILQLLQGGWHEVMTGLALIDQKSGYKDISYECTRVKMTSLDSEQIEAYIDSGEPFDKAGAYGIQGLAAAFIPRIEGCYFNVVGLPVHLLYSMLLRYKSFTNKA